MGRYLRRAGEAGVGWPIPKGWDDGGLEVEQNEISAANRGLNLSSSFPWTFWRVQLLRWLVVNRLP